VGAFPLLGFRSLGWYGFIEVFDRCTQEFRKCSTLERRSGACGASPSNLADTSFMKVFMKLLQKVPRILDLPSAKRLNLSSDVWTH